MPKWLLKLLNFVIDGLNTGILYGLIAIGYTMVYGIIKLINFAHGEIVMIGAMLTSAIILLLAGPEAGAVSFGLFLISAAVASLANGGVGIAADFVAYRPLRRASRLSALITAIGISLLLQNLTVLLASAGARTISKPAWFDETLFSIGSGPLGIPISYFVVLLWVVTLISLAVLYAIVMHTRLGTAMRACAQNPTAASLMGVRLNRVVAITFFMGSLLGAVAGIAIAIKKGSFDYQLGVYVGVVAFSAAVLGGIGNLPGAILGGLLIGVAEALAAGYLGSIPHPFTDGYVSAGYREAVSFLALIAIIVFRPQGILGSRGGDRA